jgi:hypothetical protein
VRERKLGEALLVGAAVLAVWIVGDVVLPELMGQLGAAPAALLIGLAIGGFGLVVWLADGATLPESASWSMPLGAVVAIAFYVSLGALGALIAAGGVAVVALMVFPNGAAAWWYRRVLRRGP